LQTLEDLFGGSTGGLKKFYLLELMRVFEGGLLGGVYCSS
jgi:hypothetical protein